MMEGFRRFRKASANISAALSVFGCSVFSRLETGHRVRSVGALVLWGTEPHRGYPHSTELDRVPVVVVA